MSAAIWAVVPAAGSGERMGAELPKQYLEIAGRSVLEHAIERLHSHPRIHAVVVAIAANDARWRRLEHKLPDTVCGVEGGSKRCHSVLAGLRALGPRANHDDWVIVHDAARPCVRADDIDRMVTEIEHTEVGGILAVPVRDTLKRCDGDGRITQTVDRNALWHALTPQMFRLGPLQEAIEAALADGVIVTDEAQAMERRGLMPRVVPGHVDNIKITHPDDLRIAALYLEAQRTPDVR